MLFSTLNVWRKHFVAILLCFMGIFPIGTHASQGNDIAYKLALSKELADVGATVEFYQERGFEPNWVDRSRESRKLLGALFAAFEDSTAHGLPKGLFDARAIRNDIRSIRTSADLGVVEGKITRAYLQYAQMIQFGVVRPGAVDEEIKRKRAKIDQRSYLTNLVASDAQAFFSASIRKTANTRAVTRERAFVWDHRPWRLGCACDWWQTATWGSRETLCHCATV